MSAKACKPPPDLGDAHGAVARSESKRAAEMARKLAAKAAEADRGAGAGTAAVGEGEGEFPPPTTAPIPLEGECRCMFACNGLSPEKFGLGASETGLERWRLSDEADSEE